MRPETGDQRPEAAGPSGLEIAVNGQPRHVGEGTTVSQLLGILNIEPGRVVVELNLQILKRAEHATTRLAPGDQVEIVQFVGGGAVSDTPDIRSARYQISCSVRWPQEDI
jgi:thiamine biosynthesis protein ThiS